MDTMNKIKIGVTLDKDIMIILEKYSKIENRSYSNMIEQTVKAYDQIHKTKY